MKPSASIPVVTGVTAGDDYRLMLRFADGSSGSVDVSAMVDFTGVFEPLKDHDYFTRVRVDPELGSIAWPNGADIAPETLYEAAQAMRSNELRILVARKTQLEPTAR